MRDDRFRLSVVLAVLLGAVCARSSVARGRGGADLSALPPEKASIVFSWGANSQGQLGREPLAAALPTPDRVPNLGGVMEVAAGQFHSLALRQDSTVQAWGGNRYGQLGNGTFTTVAPFGTAVPGQIPGLTGVTAVAAGAFHSLALKADGTVWTWGRNAEGQLGNGTFTTTGNQGVATPAQVGGLTDVVAVAGGSSHSLALKGDGTVWAWGANSVGQLGTGSFNTTSPFGIAVPTQVVNLTGAVAIAAGESHSMALKADGTVWTWGSDQVGQLGDGSLGPLGGSAVPGQVVNLPPVAAIAAGSRHNLALTAAGAVWAWGYNQYGQLGNGESNNSRPSPVLANINGVTAVAAGFIHSLAIRTDGSVWSWGDNSAGEMGDGTVATSDPFGRTVPVRAQRLPYAQAIAGSQGGGHSLVITAPFSLSVTPTTANAGDTLQVSWSAPPGRPAFDWIGLFKIGDPNANERWWNYTSGAPSGSFSVAAPLEAGQYEFRYLIENGRTDVARSSTVTVTVPPASSYTLTPSPASQTAGQPLSISWTAPANSSGWDWIGLFRAGDPNTGEVWYAYTGGATSGTKNLTAPLTPGDYEFRYLLNNGRTDVKRVAVTITAPSASSYSLTPAPATVAPGGALSISWTAPAGSHFFDWIGLFPVGSPNTGEVWWNYTWGATSGTYNLTAPGTAGTYEFRYFPNNTRTDVKRSDPIVVQ